MEEASCDKAQYVSKYLTNIDDITVIQGPAGRVRPRRLPDEFFSCESFLNDYCVSYMCCFVFIKVDRCDDG